MKANNNIVIVRGDAHITPESIDIYKNINKQTLDLIEKYKPVAIFDLGDFLETRRIISLKFFVDLIIDNEINFLKEIKEKFNFLKIYRLLGNHDIIQKKQKKSLIDVLNIHTPIEIIKKPYPLKINNSKILLVPFLYDYERDLLIEAIKDFQPDLIFGHNYTVELPESVFLGESTNYEEELIIDDEILNLGNFKYFAGHLHKPIMNRFKKSHFVGSLYQTDMKEMGDEKGIWVLDVNTGEIVEKVKTEYPEYREYKIYTVKDVEEIEKKEGIEIEKILRNPYVVLKIENNAVLNYLKEKLGKKQVISAIVKLNLKKEEIAERIKKGIDIENIILEEVNEMADLYFIGRFSDEEVEELKGELYKKIKESVKLNFLINYNRDFVPLKMKMKNFALVEDVEVDFTKLEKGQVYFIKGINFDDKKAESNGAGKSTLFLKSLLYAFYGIKGVMEENNEIMFPKGEGYISIELLDTKSNSVFKIERGLIKKRKKSSPYVKFFINDKEVDYNEKDEIERKIEESIIPYNLMTKLFLIDGDNIKNNLFTMTPAERLEFFTKITQMEFINKEAKYYKELLNGKRKAKDEEERIGVRNMLEVVNSTIDTLKSMEYKDFTKEIEEFEKQREKEIKELKEKEKEEAEKNKKQKEETINQIKIILQEGKNLKTELTTMVKNIINKDKEVVSYVRDKQKEIERILVENYGNMEKIKNRIKNLNEIKSEEEKRVLKPVKDKILENKLQRKKFENRKNEIEEKIKFLNKNLGGLTFRVETIEKEIDKLQQGKKKVGDKCDKCSSELTEETIKFYNQEIEIKLKELEKELENIQKDIKEKNKEIENLTQEGKELEKLIKERDKINTDLEKEFYKLKLDIKSKYENELERLNSILILYEGNRKVFDYFNKIQKEIEEFEKDFKLNYSPKLINFYQIVIENFGKNIPNFIEREIPQIISIYNQIEEYLKNENESLKSRIEELNNKKLSFKKKSEEFKNLKKMLTFYEKIEKEGNKYTKLIKMKQEEVNPYLKSQELEQKKKEETEKKIKDLEKKKKDLEKKVALYSALVEVFSNQGLKRKCFGQIMRQIEDVFPNMILKYADSGEIMLNIAEGTRGGISLKVFHKGREKSYKAVLSKGEKMRFTLALYDTLECIFTSLYSLNFRLRILDEVVNNVDDRGINIIVENLVEKAKNEDLIIGFMGHGKDYDSIHDIKSLIVAMYNNIIHYFPDENSFKKFYKEMKEKIESDEVMSAVAETESLLEI